MTAIVRAAFLSFEMEILAFSLMNRCISSSGVKVVLVSVLDPFFWGLSFWKMMINVEMLGLASSLVFGIWRTKKDQDRRLSLFVKKAQEAFFLYCTSCCVRNDKKGHSFILPPKSLGYTYVRRRSTYMVKIFPIYQLTRNELSFEPLLPASEMANIAGSPWALLPKVPFETTTLAPDFVALTLVDCDLARTCKFDASALFLNLFRVF